MRPLPTSLVLALAAGACAPADEAPADTDAGEAAYVLGSVVIGEGDVRTTYVQTLPSLDVDHVTNAEAIEAPASLSSAGSLNGGVAPDLRGNPTQVAARVSTSGIPAAALAAYQRAETVINTADRDCHLQWQLIAAIGKVESDHGRADGNTLDSQGVAQPGIYGIALDGTHGTTTIADTDAGQ